MARAALRLGQRELAELAGISPATVNAIESEERRGTKATIGALRQACEDEGLEFVGDYGVLDRRQSQRQS